MDCRPAYNWRGGRDEQQVVKIPAAVLRCDEIPVDVEGRVSVCRREVGTMGLCAREVDGNHVPIAIGQRHQAHARANTAVLPVIARSHIVKDADAVGNSWSGRAVEGLKNRIASVRRGADTVALAQTGIHIVFVRAGWECAGVVITLVVAYPAYAIVDDDLVHVAVQIVVHRIGHIHLARGRGNPIPRVVVLVGPRVIRPSHTALPRIRTAVIRHCAGRRHRLAAAEVVVFSFDEERRRSVILHLETPVHRAIQERQLNGVGRIGRPSSRRRGVIDRGGRAALGDRGDD